MGKTTNQQEEITYNKLFDAILILTLLSLGGGGVIFVHVK